MIVTAALPATVHAGDDLPFTVHVGVQLAPGIVVPPTTADVTIQLTGGCGTIGPSGSTARRVDLSTDASGVLATAIHIPTTCPTSGVIGSITVNPQNATVAPGGTVAYTAQIQGGGALQVEVSVADVVDQTLGLFALGRSLALSTTPVELATWTASGGTITAGPSATATYTAGTPPGSSASPRPA